MCIPKLIKFRICEQLASFFKGPRFKKVAIIFIFLLVLIFLYIPPKKLRLPAQRTPYLINLTNFSFLRNNEKLCSMGDNATQIRNRFLLLIVVHSRRSNFLKRDLIRRTMGTFRSFRDMEIRFAFLLGTQSKEKFPPEDNQLEPNDDLIMGSFEDTYRNLTYKHISGYKWTVEYCPEADFILKIDDDIMVDIPRLYPLISDMGSHITLKNYPIACNIQWSNVPLRERRYKNFVSFQEYQERLFPDHCGGMAYLIRRDALEAIYSISRNVNFLWIDDVWVTGILRSKAPGKPALRKINSKIFQPSRMRSVEDVRKFYQDWTNLNYSRWTFFLMDHNNWKDSHLGHDEAYEQRFISLWLKLMAVHLYKDEVEPNLIN